MRDFHDTLEASLTKRGGGVTGADTVEIRDENQLPQGMSGKLHLPEINNSGSNQVNTGGAGNLGNVNRSLTNSQSELQAMEQSALVGPITNRQLNFGTSLQQIGDGAEKAQPTHSKRYNSNSTLVGGSKNSVSLPNSHSKQQVAGSTKRASNSLTNTLSELDEILKDDSLLFHQRLNFIKKQINEDIKPVGLVSRDHRRTNKNGVSLERLE